ncbi:rhodanese-related sulfurtransferase [Pontibacter aydingkolensis]|uniref:Rhodanese-like domain-containing protein n=1 Tax=Pontibacter aydingkolensis TaxID=1911536 RepID=A0ABS7CVX8_9BACT|nr:rhodanese-like domain-containing protein [Pontibacter aydingkolensis]MBW7467995.1 rhodanese-like domain-containing protein [Pontibacter aydingkolensis]
MFNIFGSGSKKYQDLDGKTFKSQFENSSNAELLDVRTAGEYNSGSIQGAKNLDFLSGQFQAALNSLDKDKEYYVFCRSGNRSGSACNLLADKGIKAYNLAGGVGAWPK